MQEPENREEGRVFSPHFAKRGGLLPCVVQEESSKQILMLAYVNDDAIRETLKTRLATFYSTSRQELWTKGAKSGNYLRVQTILVDCDQDSLVYLVRAGAGAGAGAGACHTKNADGTARTSCFYRRLTADGLEYYP